MKVFIGGAQCDLDLDRVIGEGGEAIVVEHPTRSDRAVKLHRTDHGASVAVRGKLEVLRALAPRLPFAAMPEELVLDDAGALRGFVMRKVAPTSEPLAALASPEARRRMGLGLRDVLGLFDDVARSLEELHREGVVVGDLNDQNELFAPGASGVTWIDTDSFQVEGFPCAVSTPLTLDPMLYGPSEDAPWLTADGKPRWFSRSSDWYAFTVLLFRALTGVHPFGGVGAMGASIPKRARASESVFAASVLLPRTSRRRVEALDGELRRHFEAVFSRAERRPLDPRELVRCASEIARCSCGEERFGDAACVRCGTGSATKTGADLDVAEWLSNDDIVLGAAHAGGLRVLVRRAGAFVLVDLQDDLRVHEEAGLAASDAEPLALSSTHALFASASVGTRRDAASATVTIVDLATKRAEESSSERAFGAPACALRDSGIVRIARGHVLGSDGRGEALLATVMRNQTRVFAGASGVVLRTLAFGGATFSEVVDGRIAAVQVPPLGPGERLLEEHVFCSPPRATVVRRVARGTDEILVSSRGERTSSHVLTGLPAFSLSGAVLREDSLLVATDAGIVRIGARTGLGVVLAETEPHVGRGDTLLAHGPSLYVVTSRKIRRLARRSNHQGA